MKEAMLQAFNTVRSNKGGIYYTPITGTEGDTPRACKQKAREYAAELYPRDFAARARFMKGVIIKNASEQVSLRS